MTVLQKKTNNPIAHLTPEDIEQIGVELDAIRQSVIDTRGADDAAYIRKVIATQRKLDELLRALPDADNHLIAAESASDAELADIGEAHLEERLSLIHISEPTRP